MSELEPGTREEQLLQGILNGETSTTIEPADRKERLLKAILENGGGGGGSLPETTSADAGDFLRVDEDGEWDKDPGDDLARIDGYYGGMGVGYADQINSTTGVVDGEAYGFRPTGGASDVGTRKQIRKIVGGTVLFNQMIENGDFEDDTGWNANRANLLVANNKATLTMGLNVNYSAYLQKTNTTSSFITGRKYLVSACITAGKDTRVVFSLNGKYSEEFDLIEGKAALCSAVVTPGTAAGGLIIYVNRGGQLEFGDQVVVEFVQCFDLTKMFATADGIYPSDFRKMFPKEYYDYNAGTLLSVKTSGHKVVSFNLLDSNGEAKLVGGMKTQITGTRTALSYTTAGGRSVALEIDGDGIFTPPVNGVLSVSGPSTDTCVHLVHSGYRNGDYETHAEITYPLDDDLTLYGVPKLDDAGRPYYDGDEYFPGGTVTRRFRQIVLDGTTENRKITTVVQDPYGNYYGYLALDVTGVNTELGGGIISDRFITKKSYKPGCIWIGSSGGNLILGAPTSGITSKTEFNAWLEDNNVTVVYEVASPTTETAESYTANAVVDDFGTEEFIDNRTIPMPVGHETWYPANLRDKLQHLPNLAGADGEYIIQQTGSQMTLKPIKESETQKPAVVTLTWDSEESAYDADLNCAEIWDLFQAGQRVNVKFEIPGYAGFRYEAPIAVFGHGEGVSEYFYEVQQIDPLTSTLMCLYALGSDNNTEWTLSAISLGS